MAIKPHSALLLVDVQNDFLPGGALPVPEGDRILPKLNAYIHMFQAQGLPILASRDWHPAETTHFQALGGPWPAHCVQGTPGAAFHSELQLPENAIIVSKGMRNDEDGYTAFLARDAQERPLADILQELGVEHLYVAGLALDYCVKASALDATAEGLDTVLLIDATRAVNVAPHDGEQAVEDLVRVGIDLATLETLPSDGDEP